MSDELQAAIDKVADIKIDPEWFPNNAPLAYRHAAVGLLDAIAKLRFLADGGDPAELEAMDVRDDAFVVDLNDLREFADAFYAEGNSRSYAACASVYYWVMATGGRQPGNN